MEICFASSNPHKIREAQNILGRAGVQIRPVSLKLEELQTVSVENLVRDKVLKAFQIIGCPVFVEHTGLYISCLNEFPGGLTQIFWDTLRADAFADLIGNYSDKSLVARTIIGYCDGRRICYFQGEIKGSVPPAPRGRQDFQWDCVFVPAGYTETFAEMGDEKKNAISMRRKALDEFAKHLSGGA